MSAVKWGNLGLGAAVALAMLAPSAEAGGTLRVAMTASDVPTTTGAPDNVRACGFSAIRCTRASCCGI